MTHGVWNDWYDGWGWFLWFGFMILIFSSAGNWGYTYRVHRFSGRPRQKDAFDILDERYARGEITLTNFREMKAEISRTAVQP
jgi:putative membrane protein